MNGAIKSDVHYQEHTGVLTHKQTQPTEDIILSRNSELRKNAGVIRDLGAGQEGGSWGRQVASIPIIMYDKALREGYDLNNKNHTVAAAEMNRFLQSTDGKMCLVQGK